MKLVINVFFNGGEERVVCIICFDKVWLKLGEMGGIDG